MYDSGVWVDPERDGWRICDGGTGSTLCMPCFEDGDDNELQEEPTATLHTLLYLKFYCQN